MVRVFDGLRSVLPNVQVVIQRFPVSVCLAVLLTFWLMRGVFLGREVDYYAFALMAMFFASVGASLYAEHKKLGLLNAALVGLGAAAFVASIYIIPDDMYLTPSMMPLALLLLASTVAYIGWPAENRSFWQFNHGFWFSLLVAFLGGMLIAGLVSLLITTYGLLFDVRVPSRYYQYALILSLFLIGMLFWLSLIPASFNEQVEEGEPKEFTSKITALFVKYVFVPFFFMFALLFHGFALKVVVDGTLPTGQIGWYGMVLIAAGVGTYLMAFPTAKTGGALVRLFSSYWMWFLIIPLLLMIFAYQLRLGQYGMTPSRYFLAAFILWAVVMVGYALFMKWRGQVFDLRVIAFFAALIMGLASVGPWGAEAVSNNWQMSRLVDGLSGLGALKDGKITRPIKQDAGDSEQLRQVNGALGYFAKYNRGERLKVLLSEKAIGAVKEARLHDGVQHSGRRNRILLAVKDGLGFTSPAQKARHKGRAFTYRVLQPAQLEVPGKGALFGPFYYQFPEGVDLSAKDGARPKAKASKRRSVVHGGNVQETFEFFVEGDHFIILEGEVRLGEFKLSDMFDLSKQHQLLLQKKGTEMKIAGFASASGANVPGSELLVTSLSYQVGADGKTISGLTGVGFWLFRGR